MRRRLISASRVSFWYIPGKRMTGAHEEAAGVSGCILYTLPRFAFAQDFSELMRTGTAQEIREALAQGADVEVTDFPFWKVAPFRAEAARQYQIETEGLRPLMLAAAFNHDPEVISVLLKAGGKIDDRDYEGGTVLMWGAEYNSNPAVISSQRGRGLMTGQPWA